MKTTHTINETTLSDYKRMVKNTKRFNGSYIKSKSKGNSILFSHAATGLPLRSISYANNTITVITYTKGENK